MKLLLAALLVLLWLASVEIDAAAAPPRVRPYSGIGGLMLTIAAGADAGANEPLQLYEEPAIARLGELNLGRIPQYDWIFGPSNATLPMIVTARKGDWLRVAYDEAGREAWLNPRQMGVFQPWDVFFKGQSAKLLPGLQKRYYQLFQQPGKRPQAQSTPKQVFKVVKLENDWALVVADRESLCWLRWRDEDGRLLIGLERTSVGQRP